MSLKNLNGSIKHQRLVVDAYIHMDTIGTAITTQLIMSGNLKSSHSFFSSASFSVGTFKYAVLTITFISYTGSHPVWLPSPSVIITPSMPTVVIGGPTGQANDDLAREIANVTCDASTISINTRNSGYSVSGTILVFN